MCIMFVGEKIRGLDGTVHFPQAREWICQLARTKGSLHLFFTKQVSTLLKEPVCGGLNPSLGPEQLARGVLLAASAEMSSRDR